MKITVDESLAKKRIDKAVADSIPQYPRTALSKLMLSGHITLNGKQSKPGARLHEGDVLDVDLSPLDALPEAIDLPIVYEDGDVIVVDKPAGVISHARGRFFNEASVASFVRQKVADISGERAGIVHRLDRATSGVMVCAKNQESLSWLQQQFSDRKVKKTYLAVIEGTMPSETGRIEMPITRNLSKPQTFMVDETGKPASTNYRVLSSEGLYSLVELSPETGRTHQLRVHLTKLGHPIVGDELYGGKKAPRLLLHAFCLELTLLSGKKIKFSAPLPAIFKEYIKDV